MKYDVGREQEWNVLNEALSQLPACLADLRSPWPRRASQLHDLIRSLEQTSLGLVQELVAHRNTFFPDAASWRVVPERYPQPDPTLLLAVREWVLSIGSHPGVGLNKQKRLASVLTEILVARAAIETYSTRLHNVSPPDLVRTLSALWLLIAECWKVLPLLAAGKASHG
jgi:hypothetical protein